MTAEQVLTFLGGGGIAAVVVALINKLRSPEDRKAIHASAAKDRATGEAAVITATASAFTEVTSGLREEIERMQRVAVGLETDLASAHARAVALESQVRQLTDDLARVRAERDAALAKAEAAQGKIEQLNGQVRQLQQVLASTGRAEGKGDPT